MEPERGLVSSSTTSHPSNPQTSLFFHACIVKENHDSLPLQAHDRGKKEPRRRSLFRRPVQFFLNPITPQSNHSHQPADTPNRHPPCHLSPPLLHPLPHRLPVQQTPTRIPIPPLNLPLLIATIRRPRPYPYPSQPLPFPPATTTTTFPLLHHHHPITLLGVAQSDRQRRPQQIRMPAPWRRQRVGQQERGAREGGEEGAVAGCEGPEVLECGAGGLGGREGGEGGEGGEGCGVGDALDDGGGWLVGLVWFGLRVRDREGEGRWVLGGGEEGRFTVKRPREIVPMNLQTVAVVRDILSGFKVCCGVVKEFDSR